MSCEIARLNYTSGLHEWVELAERLRDTPLPRVVGAEDWTNFEKLTDACERAFQRYKDARQEYAAAAEQHKHEPRQDKEMTVEVDNNPRRPRRQR
ncbi:MAG: hypothetical protein E6J43_13195 [Chloroflexi bacterium]|nr:MAG: hypothetical protein E6J43_13195 [Chloroflexota bacterium]